MGLIFSKVQNVTLQQDRTTLFTSVLCSTLFVIIMITFTSSSSYLKRIFKKFIRIQIRKRYMDPKFEASDSGLFATFYQNSLCNLQKVNNEQLEKILEKNHSSAFFMDRSISFFNAHRPSSSPPVDKGYKSIDEFRETVPLTTYDDYRDYVDRMVLGGEKNLISSDPVIYFNTSSGTTAKVKLIPMIAAMPKKIPTIARIATSVIWRSLPSSAFPSAQQRAFQLQTGKKLETFERSKDGISIGSVTQSISIVASSPLIRALITVSSILPLDLVEGITDFETNTFVQLVFTLAIPDIYSYSVPFAPGFIHTVKIIENYFEEISLCISSTNFNHSSLVQNNIQNTKLITDLNQALNEITIEYGGNNYRQVRANYIRKECLKKDVPGILHRLWPSLIYVSTAIGSTFAVFKDEVQFYSGENIPLINFILYAASEEFFGILASIHTDEYFLSPTSAFLEFFKEEDLHEAQPKTLLISEIEPGHRYEMVCTTEAGLVRYRMGDVINCTRFLSRAPDLVPLPSEPLDIPRIPLISIAYRVGSLLDVYGEKTSEQHVMNALKLAVQQWREQGMHVDNYDFTSYSKCDAFPVRYVIFLELIGEQGHKIDDEQLQILQKSANSDVDRQLCIANQLYQAYRTSGKLGPLSCVLVRSGTFSTFLNTELVTDRMSYVQIKPRRLLNNEKHIQFFYNNQITTSAS